jgi:hypothetical protein
MGLGPAEINSNQPLGGIKTLMLKVHKDLMDVLLLPQPFPCYPLSRSTLEGKDSAVILHSYNEGPEHKPDPAQSRSARRHPTQVQRDTP